MLAPLSYGSPDMMTRNAARTLFHPFATAVLTPPAEGNRTLFLGAEAGFSLPEGFAGTLHAVQPFKPLYEAVSKLGIDTKPAAEGEDYDLALILLTRHRGANETMIADAIRRTKPGATIVVAGSKEDGIQSMRKRMNALGLDPDHLAKYHAQAFWFVRPDAPEEVIAKLDQPEALVLGRFRTAPGMFSHGEVDGGSQFLARYLPKDFAGAAADFGAGWGYLSAELAAASPQLEAIDLYEADHASLEAARSNLASIVPDLNARYFWHDLARDPVKNRYDLIVMNPPFHIGHAADPNLGQALIRNAAQALKSGGVLLMVANRGLPYEPVLKELFRDSDEVARNARYKVLRGVR